MLLRSSRIRGFVLSVVVLLVPLFAPTPTVAQVEKPSEAISGEDIEVFFRGGLGDNFYDNPYYRQVEVNADPKRPIYKGTFEEREGCTIHSFFGFGPEGKEQLDSILADRRETLGNEAVKKMDEDDATEYRFLSGDSIVVGGAVTRSHLSAAMWADTSASCSPSTVSHIFPPLRGSTPQQAAQESGKKVHELRYEYLGNMEKYVNLPAAQYLSRVLPDSLYNMPRVNVSFRSLFRFSKVPGVTGTYGNSDDDPDEKAIRPKVAARYYGDAYEQVFGRGNCRSCSGVMRLMRHSGQSFYVTEQIERELKKTAVRFRAGPLLLQVLTEQRYRESTEGSTTVNLKEGEVQKETRVSVDTVGITHSDTALLEEITEKFDFEQLNAFRLSPTLYANEELELDTNAPPLFPDDAPEGFSYRVLNRKAQRGGSVTVKIALPTDWTTALGSDSRRGGFVFVRHAGAIKKKPTKDRVALGVPDNVVLDVQGVHSSKEEQPIALLDRLFKERKIPLQNQAVVQKPTSTSIGEYEAAEAVLEGTGADGHSIRYRLLVVAEGDLFVSMAVVSPKDPSSEIEETIQTIFDHLDLITITN